jgi:hypothetical protein
MTPHTIVPGGERVGKSPVSEPALRAKAIRPTSVHRRFGRRPAEYGWGVDTRAWWRRIDWPMWRLIAGTVATLTAFALIGNWR